MAKFSDRYPKPVRMTEDKPLGKPVRTFDSTFSAVTVLTEMFFIKKPG